MRRSSGGTWLFSIGAALVIYILSIGPVARYYAPRGAGTPPIRRAVLAFYEPINFLINTVPPVRLFTNWYLNLWLPRPPSLIQPPPPTSGTSTN